MMFILIFGALVQQIGGQALISAENEIIGVPEIQCSDDAIVFTIKTKNSFRGNIYVRGQYNVPQCKQEFFNNDYQGATFTVKMGDCGMSRVRQLEPHGMNYVLIFVANFHPTFVTRLDRAFSVRCFYAQTDKIVTNALEVGVPDPETIEQATTIMPHCEYTLRKETLDGPIPKDARIGDKIVHRWDCDNPNYGMLVKNCYVTNGGGLSFQVIDARGCPLLSPLIQGELQYNRDLSLAFVSVSAYAFPDASMLNFQCQIQVCNKREEQCVGITPPNCPAVRKTEFMPASVVDSNVNPTQVISTFEESTQVPTTIKPVFIPRMEQNQFTSNQPFPTFARRLDELSTSGDFRRSPVRSFPHHAPKSIQTERIEALQNFNHPYFRKKDSPPPPADAKNDSSDAILHFDNDYQDESWKREPIILKRQNRPLESTARNGAPLIPKSPSKTEQLKRTRRDEEETMDVAASPLFILGEPETVDSSTDPTMIPFIHNFGNNHNDDRAKYCVDKYGMMTLAVGFALLSTFAISLTIYVLADVIFTRSRRKKGLIAHAEPRHVFGHLGNIRPFDPEIVVPPVPRISPRGFRNLS